MKKIFDKCRFVFDTLEKSGFECYAVGGCVRDMLLGLTPHDIDFTTNANPDEILQCFSEYKTFELGKKFGTISVLNQSEIYEITTYRIDGEYSDSRHPDKVEFSRNLRDDLSRRDFTVNAMAMDKDGVVVDIFNGKADLENKLIRAVGNAEKRFSEDALRIFRALRFASKLGFIIEESTSDACKNLAYLLDNVHPQRLRDELSSFIIGDNVTELMTEYREVFARIIPELKHSFDFSQITAHHRYDVFTHTIKAVGFAPKNAKIRIALLLHDIAKPLCHTTDRAGISHFNGHPQKSADIATEILRRFSFPSDFVNTVVKLIKYHDVRFEKPRLHIKRLLMELSEEEFRSLLTIQRCDILAQSEYQREEKLRHVDYIEDEFEAVLRENACLKLSDLAINGNDVMSLGVCGKIVGDILHNLLTMVMEDKLVNQKDVLINYTKEYISQIDK